MNGSVYVAPTSVRHDADRLHPLRRTESDRDLAYLIRTLLRFSAQRECGLSSPTHRRQPAARSQDLLSLLRQFQRRLTATAPFVTVPVNARHLGAGQLSALSDPSVLPGDPVRLGSRSRLQLLGDRREVVADRAGREERRACDLADGPVLLCDTQHLRLPRGQW
jgi:hypothetical protein